MKVAILDDMGRLIGYKTKKKPAEADVVVDDECDLPADGSYKWHEGTFWPVGKGHGKPERPPISDHRVIYILVKQLWDDMPQEARDWAEWYDANIKRGDV